jgi:outer membrane protein TolC
MGLAIIGLVIIGANRLSAEEPLPSQDQAIARAVEKHPDIVAAKAKLALAESELNSKRMEISRQVLQSYSNLKNFEAQASATKAKLEVARHELAATNGAGKAVAAIERDRAQAAVQEQESALIQLLLQREQIEKELRLLIGNPEGPEKKIPSQASAAARQIPHGPIVNRIRSEMKNGRTSIEVPDQPLGELLQYLSDKLGLRSKFIRKFQKIWWRGPFELRLTTCPFRLLFKPLKISTMAKSSLSFVITASC